jgi:hypothetical protein
VLSLPSCARDFEEGGGFDADTLNVPIIESHSAKWADEEAWRVDTLPSPEIGGFYGDSSYELYDVVNALRLEDGRVVVADAGTRRLQFYDAEGRFLRSAGRQGGGPGEFQWIQKVARYRGDSLFVSDYGLNRISVFDSQGNFGRDLTVVTGVMGIVEGAFSNGWFLVRVPEFPRTYERKKQTRWLSAAYILHSADGSIVDTIGSFPDAQVWITEEGLADARRFAPHGGLVALVDDRFFFGTGEAFEAIEFSWRGIPLRTIRKKWEPRAVVDTDIEAQESYEIEQLRKSLEGTPENVRRYETSLEDASFARTMPAFSRLLIDDVGNLWVENYQPPAERKLGSSWAVFDTTGDWLGRVEMTAGLTVYQIGSDFVLGLWRDADDVEYVRLYELLKPARH